MWGRGGGGVGSLGLDEWNMDEGCQGEVDVLKMVTVIHFSFCGFVRFES